MRVLSGNTIKWIAAVLMVVDHIGYFLFPAFPILRVLGRISFPLFAYMIAEGCRYTRSGLRYLGTMALFGVICQVFYLIFDHKHAADFCVFITFTLSIGITLALDRLKRALLFPSSVWVKLREGALCLLAVAAAVLLHHYVTLDYSIYGCLLPVAASLPYPPRGAPARESRLRERLVSLACFAIAMVPMCLYYNTRQWWCYLSLPILLCYSGKRGRHNQKIFFYLFYPAHLVILYLISYLIY